MRQVDLRLCRHSMRFLVHDTARHPPLTKNNQHVSMAIVLATHPPHPSHHRRTLMCEQWMVASPSSRVLLRRKPPRASCSRTVRAASAGSTFMKAWRTLASHLGQRCERVEGVCEACVMW